MKRNKLQYIIRYFSNNRASHQSAQFKFLLSPWLYAVRITSRPTPCHYKQGAPSPLHALYRYTSNINGRILNQDESLHFLLECFVQNRYFHKSEDQISTFNNFISILVQNDRCSALESGLLNGGIESLRDDILQLFDLEIVKHENNESCDNFVVIALFTDSVHYLTKCRDTESAIGSCCVNIVYKTLSKHLVTVSLEMLRNLALSLTSEANPNLQAATLRQLIRKQLDVYVKIELRHLMYKENRSVAHLTDLLKNMPYVSYKAQKSLIDFHLKYKDHMTPRQICSTICTIYTVWQRHCMEPQSADDKVLLQNFKMYLSCILRYICSSQKTFQEHNIIMPAVLILLRKMCYIDKHFMNSICDHSIAIGELEENITKYYCDSVKSIAYFVRALRFLHTDFLTSFLQLIIKHPDKFFPSEELGTEKYLQEVSMMVKAFGTFSFKSEQTACFLQLVYERCGEKICSRALQSEQGVGALLPNCKDTTAAMYLAVRIIRDCAVLGYLPEDFIHVTYNTLKYCTLLVNSYHNLLSGAEIVGFNKCIFNALVVYHEICQQPHLPHLYELSKEDAVIVLQSLRRSFYDDHNDVTLREVIDIINGPQYVASHVFTDTASRLGQAVIVTDTQGQLQPITFLVNDDSECDNEFRFRFASDIVLQDPSHRVLPIVILQATNFLKKQKKYHGDSCSNCKALLALAISQLKHLDFLGYKPLLIFESEWENCSDAEKYEYLHNSIRKLILE